ncbi:DNA-processing protein DprA [Brachyspira catarrhinii]|uniref:DNA-protecting protein DprA n=1 Tax=Brachyspira catarrhinii TaxID=2528966 RepID=A0ABY2TQ17_9SPIR|nr:DNA-processing protein DprA [Brachyspira catarrhinii]TKZ31143.1 DNA-protecting protein DprA [Brachyspira catarrhinii]
MNKNDNIKTYLIALNQIEKIGDRRIYELIKHYESVESIFEEKEKNLKELIEKKFKFKVNDFSKNEILDKAENIIKKSKEYEIGILSLFDKEYPFNLKQIDNPPYILYYKGDLKKLRRNSVSIVGTRNPTKESKKYAFDIASKLSALNITVVSGMAKGIDKEAHLGAISSLVNTAAVLGNGIDIVYPSENVKVYNKLIESGIVISEFEVGRKPDRMNFPRRNRIISGLSYATIMVEASSKSGALITVDYALNQGREVYIAPYDEKLKEYFGNHKLYKEGAKIINDITDILEDFDSIFSNDDDYLKMKLKYFEGGNIPNKGDSEENKIIKTQKIKENNKENKTIRKITENKKIEKPNLEGDEAKLYDIISKNDKVHIDDIIEKTEMKTQVVTSLLMRLEINGFIKQTAGKYYTALL